MSGGLERQMTKHQKKYYGRKDAGLCVSCARPRESVSPVRCNKCLAKKNKTNANYAKTQRLVRKEKGLCVLCGKRSARQGRTRCVECNERYREADNRATKEYREQRKKEVYQAYGNRCACCGEDNLFFLQVDHVNNDGREHAREHGYHVGGISFYKWVIDNNFPPTLQLLCANCNWGKRMNGGVCPHKSVQESEHAPQ